MSGKKQES